MTRYLLADGHHGFTTQVVHAVQCLTDEDRTKFDAVFPEWPKVVTIITRGSPLTGYYPDDGEPDAEILHWVADWIETNTTMNWEDGDLWDGFSDEDEEEA